MALLTCLSKVTIILCMQRVYVGMLVPRAGPTLGASVDKEQMAALTE